MKNLFSVEDKEYLVLNEEEREQYAYDSVKNFIEDCGAQYINGYENFIDENYFDDMLYESEKDYCINIAQESDDKFENRLIAECYKHNIISDDDFEEIIDKNNNTYIDYKQCIANEEDYIEDYTDYLCNNISSIEYAKELYGNELYKYHPNAFDIDEIIEYVIETDGYGHVISSYDGKEVEYGDYYIYRLN
jgi:hypothetical protein